MHFLVHCEIKEFFFVVLQGDTTDLGNRVTELEENGGGGSGDNSSVLELEIRVSDLETENANQEENININSQNIECEQMFWPTGCLLL